MVISAPHRTPPGQGLWALLVGLLLALVSATALASDLTASVDRTQVGQGESLTLTLRYEGQALGVIGHNGAGKSTLCLVLAQILSPDEGRAAIRGKVSTLLRLDACFNRELSGRDNLELYGAFLGLGRHDLAGRVDEIIEFSELGEFIEEPVGHYSSGMRARLAFSVAATLEPDILLLDEILGVGDRAFRAKSERRIREMMEASRLIVIVSHAIGFLRGVCTHCLWLDHGQVKAYGPADEVLDAYEEHTGGKRATTWVEEDA